jgi:hypothetical protein
MTHRIVDVDMLTTDYRIVGKVVLSSSGLLGLLSDPSKSIIEVHKAQIAYMHYPTQLVRRFDTARVIKEQLFCVCVQRREEIGPSFIAHRGYTDYLKYPLHFAVAGFEISAYIEWTGRFDLSNFMADNMNKFVAAYNATIGSSVISGLSINSPAILINFGRLDLLAPAMEEEKEEETQKA